MIIGIRALSVQDNKNGTFSIEIPSKALSEKEAEMIRNLFPILTERVHDILDQEALLAALATPEQLRTPPSAARVATKPSY